MLEKINDYLLAGGYFRARIGGIAPFDKVLGGICWSLTGCNVDVDVQFKDDLTLKEKIRLSEQAIRGLDKAGCPFRLGAHQIQGLDYEHLFPVIQWLVRKLNESRDDRTELTRRQALHYHASQMRAPVAPSQAAPASVLALARFAPKRRFKMKHAAELPVTAPKRVAAVLREYDDVASFISKTVADRRQREVEQRRILAAQKRAGAGGDDFLLRAQTDALRKSNQAAGAGAGGSGLDLDLELMGDQAGAGAGLFEALAEQAAGGGAVGHSATMKIGVAGGEAGRVADNPFLKKDAAGRMSLRPGGGGQTQEWEEEAEQVMIGDGLLETDLQKLAAKSEVAAKSGQAKSGAGAGAGAGAAGEGEGEGGSGGGGSYGLEAVERVETRRGSVVVRGAQISAALVEQMEEIEEQITDFTARQQALQDTDPSYVIAQEEERLGKQKEALEQQLARQAEAGRAAQERLAAVEDALALAQAKHAKIGEKRAALEEAERGIEREMASSSAAADSALRALVEREKQLKEEKAKVKRGFRAEKERLEEELEKAKRRQERIQTEENQQVLRAIDEDYSREYEELVEQRRRMADKNKKVSVLQRKIENTPSAIELRQYQRRFREIYDLINLKLEENKRYINLYNSLDETEKMLLKQSQYMKEIREGFRKTKNKKEREALHADLKGLLDVVKKASSDAADNLKNLKAQKDAVQAHFNDALLKERAYFERVRVFQAECDRNDALHAAAAPS